MRTWGRITNDDGTKTWVELNTATNGDDAIWVTTLIQCLLLYLNESPFYANYGLPAAQSVITQVQPDFYVARTQQQFSQYFASLIIAKIPGAPNPTYRVNVMTRQGSKIIVDVPI